MKRKFIEVINMTCPTREEYEEAVKNGRYLSDAIRREYKHRESLINELCTSQNLLNQYEKILNDKKEVIQKYEIYQELLAENKGCK